EVPDTLPRGDIPELDLSRFAGDVGSVRLEAGGDELLTIGAEHQGRNHPEASVQRTHLLTCGHLPDLYFTRLLSVTGGSGGQALTIATEYHHPEVAVTSLAMSLEGVNFFAARRLPDTHRPVLAGGSEMPAVGAPGRAHNRIRVPVEREPVGVTQVPEV